MKPTIKSLQERINKLEDKLSKVPELKVCEECGTVKSIEEFLYSYYMCGIVSSAEKDYCKSCEDVVNDRNRAVGIAKVNFKDVLKWWGNRR